MRYAILGDIHANLTALLAVLDRIDRENVDRILSVGDVVGYGPSPAACIEILRERAAFVVKGNHDAACVGEMDDRYFNNYAREAVRWTRAILSADHRDWLVELPMTRTFEHCELAHGSIFQPEMFSYTQTPPDADPSLDKMTRPVGFVGHTHIPVILWRLTRNPTRTVYNFETQADLRNAHRSLVNVGSVGQPRDEDPRAAYAIFDSELALVTIERVEYDIHREAELSERAGLPRVLADRLFLGV
jgi:diadenosine tetraphosphatase ApaH/serine/threonine PP2A family protein phosphatase